MGKLEIKNFDFKLGWVKYTAQGVSFAWVDTDGNVNPIVTKAPSVNVARPYLQISFKAASLDDLKKGGLSKLEYWLKGNTKGYVQNFTPLLSFNAMTMTDETPKTPETPGTTGGGGCDMGFGVFGVIAVLWGLRLGAVRRPAA